MVARYAPADGPDLSGAAPTSRPTPRLTDLRPGMRARITGIDATVERQTSRRLCDLGFAPGRTVTMVRRAPLGDPVILQIAEYEIALRRAQAAGILIQSVGT